MVADRKRAETIARICSTPILVPLLEADRLAERAVAHRNARAQERAVWRDDYYYDWEPAEVGGVEQATLERWMVNYLRHELTRYEVLLDGLTGQTGRLEAEGVLRNKVYGAIGNAYPSLADECRRQLAIR